MNVQLLCVGVQRALAMAGSQACLTDEHPGPFSRARFSARTQWESLMRMRRDVPVLESVCLTLNENKHAVLRDAPGSSRLPWRQTQF